MSDRIEIKTSALIDGKILTDVYFKNDFTVDHLKRLIIDTLDKNTRKALIDLGWKPPEKEINIIYKK